MNRTKNLGFYRSSLFELDGCRECRDFRRSASAMKPSPFFLVISIAANIGLFGWYFASVSPTTKNQTPAVAAATTGTAPADRQKNQDVLSPELGRTFQTLAPAALLDQLRASDLPVDLINHVVMARIFSRVEARQRELVAEALRTARPWQLAATRGDRFALLTPARRKELRDLETEARDETLRLLGPALLDRDGLIAFKYGFVPGEKAVRLDALDRDYVNLATLAKEEARYLRTEADRNRDEILQGEQERDLAALLTPEEREAYELRVSTTARSPGFQNRMAALQPSEAEYRALFALQKAFDEKTLPVLPSTGPVAGEGAKGARIVQVGGPASVPDENVRLVLGEERFADWKMAGTGYYRNLSRLAAANGLSADIVKQVGSLLNDTSSESWRIANDSGLGAEEKTAALAELTARARAQVSDRLGPALASSYLTSVPWFDRIATGTAVHINGTTISFRNVQERSVESQPTLAPPTTARPGAPNTPPAAP